MFQPVMEIVTLQYTLVWDLGARAEGNKALHSEIPVAHMYSIVSLSRYGVSMK